MTGSGYYPPLSPFGTGLAGKCPRCGRGRLFTGLLQVRGRCEVCDLDLSPHDSGDGPAVFVILLLGPLVVGLMIWVEVAWTPPVWVHAALWIPTILILSMAMLRVMKGILIALHFRNLRHKYDER